MIIIIKNYFFFSLFPVGAIKREAGRLRDDWEVNLCSGGAASTPEAVSDTYCFEMMSLVLGNNIFLKFKLLLLYRVILNGFSSS